jgi:hypothetical protein
MVAGDPSTWAIQRCLVTFTPDVVTAIERPSGAHDAKAWSSSDSSRTCRS